MKKMTIVTFFDPYGDMGGSAFTFDVADDMTEADVINACIEAVYADLCKDYMDESGVFELPDYDRTMGDVLGEVADNVLVQRALSSQSIEFVGCAAGTMYFVENDIIAIDTDGDRYLMGCETC